MSFPFPDVDAYDKWVADMRGTDFDTLTDLANSFEVRVNGKVYPFKKEIKAIFKHKDVSRRLQSMGLDLTNFGKEGKTLQELSADNQAVLLQEGLIEKIEAEDPKYPKFYYQPSWKVRIIFYWEQVFPAGKIVHIEHKYKTQPTSDQYCLAKDYVDSRTGEVTPYTSTKKNRYVDIFCVDERTRAGVDRLIRESRKKLGKTGGVDHNCEAVEYILTTANTWHGPIKNFRLTIEKPKNAIVSTCFPGIKKLDETKFESRLKDFRPDRDLNVLFVR